MKVLVVGGGGREHALAWKVAQSDQVETVYIAPGNAGTATEKKLENIAIQGEDIETLKNFALSASIDLTIIGPEAPLVSGVVDVFQQAGLPCFGPSRNAAIIEGSKSFTKNFLKKYQIQTAEYQVFTEIDSAVSYVKSKTLPVVIKVDGLAAGKGVTIAKTEGEAVKTIGDILVRHKFGAAGYRVVIEEFLEGEEASFIVMTDGKHVLPLVSSQDHKTRDDGDKGPNTGGMGACSPAPIIDQTLYDRIMQEIILPAVKGMESEGRSYTGFLYAGIIITRDGIPKVLEFNCRGGDPETQPIMMRLKSDFPALCLAAINKTLDQCKVEWDRRAALSIVTASAGYPENATTGDAISGLESVFSENVKVFHSGTERKGKHIVTAGGRVLCITALGNSMVEAQQQAYEATKQIHYEGMFYRKDIGYRAVAREN